MKKITTTLLFIIKDNKILLPMKKRGQGQGFYNGVGGKMQDGENIVDTLLRETKEEINVTPVDFRNVGKIDFDLFYKGEKALETMEIFIANDFEGQLKESEEMKPFWFDLDKIPYDKMFPDDRLWIEKVLNGKLVKGKIKMDKNFNMIENELSFE